MSSDPSDPGDALSFLFLFLFHGRDPPCGLSMPGISGVNAGLSASTLSEMAGVMARSVGFLEVGDVSRW
ncbi:MAG: hypothetical protein ACYCQN_04790 [Acidiferrobacteraceae bacterium]